MYLDCTSGGLDPWITGNYIKCCEDTKPCLGHWYDDELLNYICTFCDYDQCIDSFPCVGSEQEELGCKTFYIIRIQVFSIISVYCAI